MRLIHWVAIACFTPLSLVAQNSPGMPAGKIGIGNTTPTQLLQVHNATAPGNSIGSIAEVANFSCMTNNYAQLKFLFRRHSVASGSWENVSTRIQHQVDASNQGYIEFNPENDTWGMALGNNVGEMMRLKANGYIGIGTKVPQHRLDVNGTIASKGSIYLDIGDLVLTRTSHSFGFIARPNLDGFRNLQVGVEGGGPLDEFRAHAQRSYFTGKVGIGTSDPGNCSLAVEGTIGARKVKVQQSAWADYVFEDDYKLLKLSEVEKFIKSNRHLPDVPSAKEVENEGLDLGNNQAVLLKKIEELTLYIIDLEKRIKKLEKK